MNGRPSNFSITSYVVALVGAFLIMFLLVRAMQHYMRPPPVNQARADERRKALATLKAANTDALQAPAAWLDKGRGIVRLPIDRAIQLTLQEWTTNSVQARSNLFLRLDKATYVPPKPPEKPSEYE